MYRKDPMIEEIRNIRRKIWDESKHNPHSLVENIQKEAKEFIEKRGYRYVDTGDGHRKIVKQIKKMTAVEQYMTTHVISETQNTLQKQQKQEELQGGGMPLEDLPQITLITNLEVAELARKSQSQSVKQEKETKDYNKQD
ncbi:MAG: hypothetical protein ABH873_03510 [Candidatus Firestonebacteria bacterium]